MKKYLYISVMLSSIVLFALAMTVFSSTKMIAPLIIVLGLYLFVGGLVKLCKMNEKLKNTVVCSLDLLFWLP